ncbi:hypothetical protein K431DRAFT_220774 [Polychaeton citri CBS 116435]|uniref:LITAF domain-containing protein n=1 Tax=Polychaeton citri CBS 116435 TaxID=1314669 RepID=A0A9P4Q9F8_9PEZI|nr:hypothetical protein K431DRAFT_220774 [Polychaeton citri CBS 116435]
MSTEKEVVSFPNTSASSPSQYPEHCPITSVSPPPLTPSEPAPAAVNQDRKLDPSDLIEQPLPAEEVAYVTPLRKLGAEVAWIDCQFCNTRARTRIVEEDSGTTACYGVLLCLICWPLACLPCCLGWAQDINHYCTNCNKQVVHKPYDGQIQIFERDSSSRLPNQIPSKYTNDAPPRYQAQISPQQEERLATSQHVAVGSGQQPVATVEEPARPEGASPQDTMSQGARYG